MGNVRWRGYDHPEMFEMINSGDGASLSGPMTKHWETLTSDLEGISTDLNDGLKKLGVTWEGDAADAAQAGLNPLQQWSQDAQTGTTIMGISSTEQGTFVSTAKNEMPQPVKVTTPAPSGWDKVKAGGLSALGINGPAKEVAQQSADHEAQEAAQNAAAQKAVATMTNYQSSTEMNTSTLGTFVPAPDVVLSVDPESGHKVSHVLSNKKTVSDPGSNDPGTTHASGLVNPTGTHTVPTNPGGNQTLTPVGSTPTTGNPPVHTPPTQTTSPNWANPPSTANPTNPTNPVNTTPNPTGVNPTGPNEGNPNGPGRNPITTNPFPGGDPEGPGRNGTPPNTRGPGGITEPPGGRGTGPGTPRTGLPTEGGTGPGRGGNGTPRSGLPGGPGGRDQTRGGNGRLRPGSGPSAFEEGGRGGRPGVGARGAGPYSYGEGTNGAGGRGGAGGVGGAGGRGGESTRGGNRSLRGGASAELEEGRAGRGGNAGANGSRGSGGRMGRGQRGEDEDDYEYQHADYLVDTEDVFLDDRLVAPPVIGERPTGA